MNNIKPKDLARRTEFGEMPKRVQVTLFVLSVWAYYIRRNAVGAWRLYWRVWYRNGGA